MPSPQVEIGMGVKCTVVPYVSKTPAYLANFADHAAFRIKSGFWTESWMLAGVRGLQRVMSSNSEPPSLLTARMSGLSRHAAVRQLQLQSLVLF